MAEQTGDRARSAVVESIRRYGSGDGDAMEPIYDAFRAAVNDALEKAANELDYRRWETQSAEPDVSEGYRRAAVAIRALKDTRA